MKFLIIALMMTTFAQTLSASDNDGRCLKRAERHCSGIKEAFGSASPQYYECVSRRLNQCLRTGH
jgi:hypothetical protein